MKIKNRATWQQKIISAVTSFGNNHLLLKFTLSRDGWTSKEMEFEAKELEKELYKRLIKIKFIDKPINQR